MYYYSARRYNVPMNNLFCARVLPDTTPTGFWLFHAGADTLSEFPDDTFHAFNWRYDNPNAVLAAAMDYFANDGRERDFCLYIYAVPGRSRFTTIMRRLARSPVTPDIATPSISEHHRRSGMMTRWSAG